MTVMVDRDRKERLNGMKKTGKEAGGKMVRRRGSAAALRAAVAAMALGTSAGTAFGYYTDGDGRNVTTGYAVSVTSGVLQQSVGFGSDISVGAQSTAVGNNVNATGYGAVAVGGDDINGFTWSGYTPDSTFDGNGYRPVTATGNASVAVGSQAYASADVATALGARASAYGWGSTALGSHATAGADRALAIMGLSSATGMDNIAIGTQAQSIYQSTNNNATTPSIAIGGYSTASGANSVALGTLSKALGERSLALGPAAQTGLNAFRSVSVGWSAGTGSNSAKSVFLGAQAGAGLNGTNNIVLGYQDNVPATSLSVSNIIAIGNNTSVTGNNAVALGNGLTNSVASSVLLGNGSTVAAPIATTSVTLLGTTYNFAGRAPISTVSIGSANGERTLTNLAAGRVSATSTDAVNGSQLFATNQALSTLANGVVRYDANGDGSTNTASITLTGTGGTIIHNLAAGTAQTDAINLGQLTPVSQTATAAQSAAAANTASITTINQALSGGLTFAADNGTPTAVKLGDTMKIIGDPANANIWTRIDGNSVMIRTSMTPTFDSVAAGSFTAGGLTMGATGIDMKGQKLTNVGAGNLVSGGTDGVNAGQLYGALSSVASALGTSVSGGGLVPTSYTIGGNQYGSVGEALAAVNRRAGTVVYVNAAGERVAQGTDGKYYKAGDLTNGKPNTGAVTVDVNTLHHALVMTDRSVTGGSVLSNVASGKLDTDAASVAQLKGAVNALGGGAAVGADGSVTGPTYMVASSAGNPATASTAAKTVGDALSRHESRLVSVESAVGKGITFTGTSGSTVRKLGDTLAVTGGNANITTAVTDDALKISLSDSPTFSGKVSAKGFDAGGQKITGVAAGDVSAASTDAVNGGQLFGVQTKADKAASDAAAAKTATDGLKTDVTNLTTSVTANTDNIAKGLNFTGDGGNTFNAKLGGTVKIAGDGGNIKTAMNNGTLTVTMNKTPSFDSVTAGGVKMSADGIDMSSKKLTKVGAGAIAAGGTDGVNAGQLYGALSSVASALGTTVSGGGLASQTYKIGGGTYSSVGDAFKAVGRQAGTVVYVNSDGARIYKGTDDKFYTSLDSDGKGIGTAYTGTVHHALVNPDGTVTSPSVLSNVAAGIKSTDAVNVSQLTPLATALGTTVDAATGVVSAPSYSVTSAIGGTASPVTTVGAAITAHENHLTALDIMVGKPLTFAGNNGSTTQALGTTLGIKGTGNGTAADYSSANVYTSADNTSGVITISIANAPIFTGKVTAQGFDAGGQAISNVKAGSAGDDAANVQQLTDMEKRLTTNVTGGAINSGSTAAVNGGQIYNISKSVADLLGGGAGVSSTTGTLTPPTYTIGNNNYNSVGNALAAVNRQAGTVVYTLDDGTRVYRGSDGKFYLKADLNADGSAKTGVTGHEATEVHHALLTPGNETEKMLTASGSLLSNVAAGKAGTDAVNVTQLKAVVNALGGGTTLNVNGTITAPDYKLTPGTAAERNYNNVGDVVRALTGGTVGPMVAVEKDTGNRLIYLEKAGAAGDKTGYFMASDVIADNKLKDLATITASPLAGSQIAYALSNPTGHATVGTPVKIQNVANGTAANDVVNVSQLTAVGLPADGSKPAVTYDGTDKKTITLGNTATNKYDPVAHTGGVTIGNVAEGKNPGDAVNYSQLSAVKTAVETGWNVGDGTTTGKMSSGDTLKVTGDANIATKLTEDGTTKTLTVSLSASPAFGTVKINDGGKGTITGLTAGTVASGSTDAVNGGQLYTANKAVADALGTSVDAATGNVTKPSYTLNGMTYDTVGGALTAVATSLSGGWTLSANTSTTGESPTTSNFKLGDTMDISSSSGNLTVGLSSGNYTLGMVNNPTFTGKVTAAGLNLGGNRLENLGTGTAATDAVTLKQLEDMAQSITNTNATKISLTSPMAYTTTESGGTVIAVARANDGKFYKTTEVNPDGSLIGTPSPITTPIGVSAMNAGGSMVTPVRLANIEAGTQAADAVNFKQLKDANQSIATALGGKAAVDPATGAVTAPTYKVLGAEYHSAGEVFNAMNHGIVGTVVYTDATGAHRLVKVGGKFYNEGDVDQDGNLQGSPTPVETSDVRLSSVGADGKVSDGRAIILGNVAAGTADTDAVNVSQLKALGLTPGGGWAVTYDDSNKTSVTLGGTGSTTSVALHNVASGSATTDAVNLGQLTAAKTAVTDLGFALTDGSGTNKVSKKLGEAASITGLSVANGGTGNIDTSVASDGTALRIDISKTPKFGNITIDGDTNKITGLTAGVADTDAVNVTQLKRIIASLGGGMKLNADGTVELPSYVLPGRTYNNIGSVAIGVKTGTVGPVVFTDGNGGRVVYLIDPKLNNTTTYKHAGYYKLSDVATDGRSLKPGVKPDDAEVKSEAIRLSLVGPEVNTDPGNTGIGREVVLGSMAPGVNATDGVNVGQLKPLVTALGGGAAFNAVTGAVTGPTYNVTSAKGGTASPVSTVGEAIAAHELHFKALDTAVDGSITFAGNSGTSARKFGEVLGIKGTGTGVATDYASTNVYTSVESGTVTISIANAPTFTGKVTAHGFDAGGEAITSVKAGSADGDAVNFQQLKDLKNGLTDNVTGGAINSGSTKAVNGGQIYDISNSVAAALGGSAGVEASTGKITLPSYTFGKSTYKTVGDALMALNRQSGTVVYVDENGARLFKGSDDKFYHALNSDGTGEGDQWGGAVHHALLGFDGAVDKGSVLSNVGPGVKDTDAVNISQLKSGVQSVADALGTKVALNTGVLIPPSYAVGKPGDTPKTNVKDALGVLNDKAFSVVILKGDGTTTSSFGLGDTLSVKGDNGNVTTSIDGPNKTMTVRLSASPKFGSIVINPTGNANTITGLAVVTLAENGDAAATTGQVYQLQQDLKTANTAFGNLTIKAMGNTGGDKGATTYKPADGLAILGGAPDGGTATYSSTNVRTIVGEIKDPNDPQKSIKSLTINIADSPVFTGTVTAAGFKATSGTVGEMEMKDNLITGLKNTTWNGTAVTGRAATEDQLQKAVEGLSGTISTNAGNAVNYDAKEKTSVTLGGKDASTGNPVVTGGVTLANVKAGTNDGDAVNLGQLKGTEKRLAELLDAPFDGGQAGKPTYHIGGNDYKSVGAAFAAVGRQAGTVTYVDAAGVRVFKATDGKFYQGLDKDGKGIGAGIESTAVHHALLASDGSTTTVSVLSNVAPGKIATDSTEAVNGSQLHAAKKAMAGLLGTNLDDDGNYVKPKYTIGKTGDTKDYETVGTALKALSDQAFAPLTFTGDSGADAKVYLGGTLPINGDGGNITTEAAASGITIRMAPSPKFGDITINPLDSTKKNTNKITGLAGGTDPNDAVNKGQLDAVKAVAEAVSGNAVTYDDATKKDHVTLGGAGHDPVTLSNVKSGAVTGDSTDAINGSQLHGLASSLAGALGGGAAVDGNGNVTKPNFTVKGADGADKTETSVGGALSTLSGAVGANQGAIAKLQQESGAASQKFDDLAVQYDTKDKNSIKLGGQNHDPVALSNVKAGGLSAGSTDAVNGSQLHATNERVGAAETKLKSLDGRVTSNATAIGNNSKRIDSVEDRYEKLKVQVQSSSWTTGTEVAKGTNGKATGAEQAVGNGNSLTFAAGNNVALDMKGDGQGKNTLTVSMAENPVFGGTVKAKGLAVVTRDKDGKEVKGPSMTATGIDAAGKKITGVADGTDPTDAVNRGQLEKAMGGAVIPAMNAISSRLRQTEQRVDSVGAMAAAFSAMLPLDYDEARPTTITAGFGHYGGENAVALGVMHYINRDVLVNGGVALSSDEKSYRLGVSIRMGRSPEVKRGSRTVRVSTTEMAAIRRVDQLTGTVESQQNQIDELKQQVQQLLQLQKKK